MSGNTLRSVLPAVYGPMLSAAFDRPAIEETRATCMSCEMCNKGNMPEGVSAVYFEPNLKCCTYHPSLPNFLVGAILSDEMPEMQEGARRMRAAIEGRIGVTPHWLGPSKKWEVLYDASWRTSFGRSEVLRCPYLTDDNRCSVWRHRETVCSTFFCKTVGGAISSAFWQAQKNYFCYAEECLARWAAKQIDEAVSEPPNAKGTLTLSEVEGIPMPADLYARYWGAWVGREAEWYVKCHEKVKTVDAALYETLVDKTKNGANLLETMMKRYELIGSKELPERLAINPKLRSLPVIDGGVVVTTPYNPYDSFRLESELWDILKEFKNDETVTETRTRLAKDQGIEFEDALLLELSNHSIMVTPKPGEEHGQCMTAPQAARTSLGLRTTRGR